MERETANLIVKILAALEWVAAAFCILFGLLFVAAGPWLASMALQDDPELAAMGPAVTAVLVGFGILFLVLAAIGILTGIGLWRLRNWGRILALVFSWLPAVWALVMLLVSAVTFTISGVLWNLFSLAFCVVWIWLLQFQPDVVALFKAPRPVAAPAKAAPAKKAVKKKA